MRKRSPQGTKTMPIPEGTTEVFEVFSNVPPGRSHVPYTLYGFFQCNRDQVVQFVKSLNDKIPNKPRDQWRWRHRAVLTVGGNNYLVNLHPIFFKEFPHEQFQQEQQVDCDIPI